MGNSPPGTGLEASRPSSSTREWSHPSRQEVRGPGTHPQTGDTGHLPAQGDSMAIPSKTEGVKGRRSSHGEKGSGQVANLAFTPVLG